MNNGFLTLLVLGSNFLARAFSVYRSCEPFDGLLLVTMATVFPEKWDSGNDRVQAWLDSSCKVVAAWDRVCLHTDPGRIFRSDYKWESFSVFVNIVYIFSQRGHLKQVLHVASCVCFHRQLCREGCASADLLEGGGLWADAVYFYFFSFLTTQTAEWEDTRAPISSVHMSQPCCPEAS